MKNKLKDFLREDISDIKEYEILDAEGMIKLDAMENPFDIDLKFEIESISKNKVNINRYPDGACKNLTKKLRQDHNLKDNFNILVGNGSDELIQILCMAFSKKGNTVLCPQPTFSMYKSISNLVGLKFKTVPLENDFSLNINEMLNNIKQTNPALIFLAYPNNPTANLWNRNNIKKIIENTNGLVVIDEAYSAFSGDSFLNDIDKYENLAIMKTFSKVGLAGLRLGYLIAENSLIKEFNKIRLPFNVNTISQKIAELALDNKDYLDEQSLEIISFRESLLDQMMRIEEIEVYNSSTNFILFKIKKGSADDIFNKLLKDKILIKNMSNTKSLEDCLRVTVGTEKENNLFIQSLKNALN